MENSQETLTFEEVPTEVIFQQDKAQIDRQIATAKAYPRNITRATEDSVAIVTLDTQTASTCTYSLPRGGKSLSGPSVHLALILAQNWGNLRVEAKVSSIDNTTVTSQAVCFDLEKNFAIKVEVKRSIMTRTGRMNDDMITVTGNAANSIALRNAILKVIPRAVVDKVYNSAKQTITGDISDKNKLLKKRKDILQKFKDQYNVSEKEVLDSIGKASVSNITADDLVTLMGFGQSIKDGDSTVELIFKPKKSTTTKEDLKNSGNAKNQELP